jgi:ABC-type nitrate/sulfonate/bicarbonate transport system ATPase subunit
MQEWLVGAMAQVPRTVLLVTHDVEEALLLSQQVVVLSARPGRVVRVIEADHRFEGSRLEIITSPEFVSLKQQALEALGS